MQRKKGRKRERGKTRKKLRWLNSNEYERPVQQLKKASSNKKCLERIVRNN